MVIFTISFCCLFLIYFIGKREKWVHPSIIMLVYWIGLLFFASLQLFGLYSISNWGYFVFAVGLVSFCLGSMYGGFFSKRVSIARKREYVLDYKLIYILYIIVILFLLYNFKNVLDLLSSGYTWAKIRRLYSNQGQISGYNEVTMSAWNVMMNQFVSTPTIYASLPIAVSDMLIGKKDKKLFVMTLIMMFLWMMTSGGRSIVLWLAIYIVFGIFIIKKRNFRIPKKVKKIIQFSFIPLIIVFIFITVQRKGESLDIFREAYIYFPVGLKNFDYHIQQFSSSGHQYFFGASSFYGFIYPIIFLLKQIGIMDYPQWILDARNYSFTILEPNSFIGLDMNAYATVMYQPYLDGGIIGVILILFLFGILCGYYYKKIDTNIIQSRYLTIYLFLIQKILFSQVRFYFTQTQQAIALVIIIIVFVNTHSLRNKVHFITERKKRL